MGDDVVTVNGRRYVPEQTYEITEGARRIARERADQITLKGWTTEHDDEHNDGGLGIAAGTYLLLAYLQNHPDGFPEMEAMLAETPEQWPWSPDWWKPSKQPIRNLEKAGALIAAEIDRLVRKQHTDLEKRLDDMGV